MIVVDTWYLHGGDRTQGVSSKVLVGMLEISPPEIINYKCHMTLFFLGSLTIPRGESFLENEANPERSELRDRDHLIHHYIVWWKTFLKIIGPLVHGVELIILFSSFHTFLLVCKRYLSCKNYHPPSSPNPFSILFALQVTA